MIIHHHYSTVYDPKYDFYILTFARIIHVQMQLITQNYVSTNFTALLFILLMLSCDNK